MRTIYYEQDDKIIVEHREDDVEPVIKAARELQGLKAKSERIGDWHHAMKVPPSIIMKIMDETGLDFFKREDWPEIWKILKRDYAIFKTTPHNL